jgi:Mn-dependent DtxR family transcriptional regulator
MCRDRLHTDTFSLTQQFIALMLGVRRPTVTMAVGLLQEEGLIKSERGLITILDREGLEESACECYRIIRESMAIK